MFLLIPKSMTLWFIVVALRPLTPTGSLPAMVLHALSLKTSVVSRLLKLSSNCPPVTIRSWWQWSELCFEIILYPIIVPHCKTAAGVETSPCSQICLHYYRHNNHHPHSHHHHQVPLMPSLAVDGDSCHGVPSTCDDHYYHHHHHYHHHHLWWWPPHCLGRR